MVTKFNKDEKKQWSKFRMGKKSFLSRAEFEMVSKLHAAKYKHSFYLPCTCNPKVIKQWIKDLNKIWDNGD
jgi:hypothetical protein|tara:strand:+ start:534 stop:746 length:213 start_codon:yes stop_codon:yes gene_type:complete